MMRALRFVLLGVAVLTGGCSTPGSTTAPLVPNKVFKLTANTSIPLSGIVGGALVAATIYYVYDPLAPNWEIEESRLDEERFRLSLRMKRYHTGGAGESMQVVKRRVAQLQQELGYGSYQLLEYTEGIDSPTLGAQRTAEAVIKLAQRQDRFADSYLQNLR